MTKMLFKHYSGNNPVTACEMFTFVGRGDAGVLEWREKGREKGRERRRQAGSGKREFESEKQ